MVFFCFVFIFSCLFNKPKKRSLEKNTKISGSCFLGGENPQEFENRVYGLF